MQDLVIMNSKIIMEAPAFTSSSRKLRPTDVINLIKIMIMINIHSFHFDVVM